MYNGLLKSEKKKVVSFCKKQFKNVSDVIISADCIDYENNYYINLIVEVSIIFEDMSTTYKHIKMCVYKLDRRRSFVESKIY